MGITFGRWLSRRKLKNKAIPILTLKTPLKKMKKSQGMTERIVSVARVAMGYFPGEGPPPLFFLESKRRRV